MYFLEHNLFPLNDSLISRSDASFFSNSNSDGLTLTFMFLVLHSIVFNITFSLVYI